MGVSAQIESKMPVGRGRVARLGVALDALAGLSSVSSGFLLWHPGFFPHQHRAGSSVSRVVVIPQFVKCHVGRISGSLVTSFDVSDFL